MKTKYITSILFLASIASSQAITVADPTAHIIAKTSQVENIAKYVEMVNNQVEQINTLKGQLEQVTEYVDRFGDPESLLDITGVDDLISSFNQSGVGKTIETIRSEVDGASAIKYTASGLYTEISDQTASGVDVERNPEDYKEFAAVQNASANFSKVYDDVQERRTDLKENIAETTEALEASTTDAETQKLTGVLIAQSSELEAIDSELNAAAYQATLQDIENRNEDARQSQAAYEEHAADKEDAYKKMQALLQPDTSKPLKFGKPNW